VEGGGHGFNANVGYIVIACLKRNKRNRGLEQYPRSIRLNRTNKAFCKIVFSSAHVTLCKINHMLDHKISFNKLKYTYSIHTKIFFWSQWNKGRKPIAEGKDKFIKM
jgi:hypothetical protein